MGLTEQLIRNAILAAMTAAEFYADALMEVIEGRASADKAHCPLSAPLSADGRRV